MGAAFLTRSQNLSYALADSAFSLMIRGSNVMEGGQYRQGAALWKEVNRKYKVDPAVKARFLFYAWDNKDIAAFKETLQDLVRNHGFTLEDLERRRQLHDEMMANPAMSDWFKNIYDNSRKGYLFDNAKKLWIIQKCKDYCSFHEKTGHTLQNAFVWSNDHSGDSLRWRHIDSIRLHLSYELYVDVFELCSKIRYLPNNFDCASFDLSADLMHNLTESMLSPYQIEKKWLLMRPYFERACADGKMNPYYYLYAYDLYQYHTSGQQYYGTLKPKLLNLSSDIKIIDEASVNERRLKYGLKPLKG